MLDRIESVLSGLGADTVHVEMDAAGGVSAWLGVCGGREIFATFAKDDFWLEYELRGDNDVDMHQIVLRLEDALQEVQDILNEK